MSRGVMTVTDAVSIVYVEHGCEENWDWDDFIEGVRSEIKHKFSSFQDVDKWDGREEHRILENDLARVVICEYCGLASINLAVREDGAWYYDRLPLAAHWCRQIAPKFEALFSDRLRRIATASNGESFYEKVNA